MSIDCSCCKKVLDEEEELIMCDGCDLDCEKHVCDNYNGFLCIKCRFYDAEEKVWRCEKCAEDAYFYCGCCGLEKPRTNDVYIGQCDSDDCECEDLCKDCAYYDESKGIYLCGICKDLQKEEEKVEPTIAEYQAMWKHQTIPSELKKALVLNEKVWIRMSDMAVWRRNEDNSVGDFIDHFDKEKCCYKKQIKA